MYDTQTLLIVMCLVVPIFISLSVIVIYDTALYRNHSKKIEKIISDMVKEAKLAEEEQDPDVIDEIEEIKLDLKELRGIEFPEDSNLQ